MNRRGISFEEGAKGRTTYSQGALGERISAMTEDRFRGATVRTLPKANRTYGNGRVCAEPGCETKLSVYNKWKYCWQHEPVHAYIPRGKRKSRTAA
jgi:hypothetical protein